MTDKLHTISADDVVEVSSVEGVDYIEVRLLIDTGDKRTWTTLSARQADKLAAKLTAHAHGQGTARHTTSCRIEGVNNAAGDRFWVCPPGCPTLPPAAPAEEPKEPPASLREALKHDDATVAKWWARWSERNPNATASVAELDLSPADRARSERIRIATLGPSTWVTGP